MKYILTEKQLEVIEIGTARGRYNANPEEAVWEVFNDELKKKKKIESFKKYFSKNSNLDINRIGDNTILSYFEYLSRGYENAEIPKEIKKEDVSISFAYYIAKHYFDLKKGLNISYIRIKDNYGDFNYFFFDSAFKIYVGMILTINTDDLSGKSAGVKTSSAVKSLIGQGYGTKMYMSVLKDFDYLKSDTLLYTGSLRMWRDVLPKYVHVWAVTQTDILTRYIPQTPNKRIKTDKIKFFVASYYHDEIG